MNDEFVGLAAVVTGAAQGIGLAIARELHSRGARLVLIDCNSSAVAAVAQSLRCACRSKVSIVVADLGDPAAILSLKERVAAFEPAIDILVNNAGIELDLSFADLSPEAFDRVIAVNLRGPFLITQALVPLFPTAGGVIVNISSIHADHAFPNSIPYACSKAGLVALTRNLALELAPRGIRVNAVCPGYIDTPMWNNWLRTSPDPEALARQTAALHPLGRRGLPDDVASAVVYLASPRSGWITGTRLIVDGGLTIRIHS